MRDVVQVMRFYMIAKRIGYRSIESLMDSPSWSPLLTLCVKRLKEYPDAGIKICREVRREIEGRKFKFRWNKYDLTSSGEEELPRGTVLDWLELKELTREIEKYLAKYKVVGEKKKTYIEDNEEIFDI